MTKIASAVKPAGLVWDRAATFSLFFANGFGFGVWAGTLPRLKEAQGLSDAGLGALLFAISAGAIVAMPLTGWLAGRLGAARVAAGGGVVAPMLLCLPSLVTGWPALLASGLALGAVLGTMDVAMNGRASAVERAWGLPVMSSFHAGWSIGGLGGSAAAGAMAAAGLGLSYSYALPALLIALLALPGFSQRDDVAIRVGSSFALPRRALLGVAAVAGLSFIAEGAVADWSGVYLRSVLAADAAWAAAAYAFYAMAMAAGRLAGDAVVRRIGPAPVVRFGGALAAAGFAVLLAVPRAWAADAGLVLVGLGLSNLVPIAFSAAGRLQGTAGIAMAATTGYAGFMASPPLIGAVAEAFGLRTALLLILAAVVAIAGLSRTVAAVPATP